MRLASFAITLIPVSFPIVVLARKCGPERPF
jgi:hypothetical protein